MELHAERDYRRDRLIDMGVYFTPLGPAADGELVAAFNALTDIASAEPEDLSVMGRVVLVPKAAKGVAWFEFADLCEKPLGSPDYLAIAKAYHTVFIANVPILPPAKRNEAKRMVTLIDALYESKINVVVSAAAGPMSCAPRATQLRHSSARLRGLWKCNQTTTSGRSRFNRRVFGSA